MRVLFLSIIALSITACSGGGSSTGGSGSGSNPSTEEPQFLKAPQLNCGSKDCLSGAAVSSSSLTVKNQGVSTLATGAGFSAFKDGYDTMKTHLAAMKKLVNVLNDLAKSEGLKDCADIPTAGTLT